MLKVLFGTREELWDAGMLQAQDPILMSSLSGTGCTKIGLGASWWK